MKKKALANWGNYPLVQATEASFTFSEQLNTIMQGADHVIARGNGRCYGDASLAQTAVSTLKHNRILSFDRANGIFECQCGITLDAILEVIVPKGWFLPVTPGTKFITVGGAVASDVHGKNHHVDGSFSRHIVDMDVAAGDGRIYTCSPQSLPDLFWATCGGMGLTGMITRIKFRLKKVETAYIKQKQIKARNLEEVVQLFETYKHYTYSVAWIDCLQKGAGFGRSILMVGEHATRNDLTGKQLKAPLETPSRLQLKFPFYFPSFLLNQFTIKAFNALYYGKNLKKEQDSIVSYEPFFYPLDVVHDWNKGYGRKGFVQYQFVLPLSSKEGLIEILKKISDKGMGSFLAVLKVFGQQDDLISFPKQGYTLALDFPVRKNLFSFLDELDEIVLHYGGRLYLSKDARMQPEIFWRSYANAEKFASIVKAYNPQGSIRSFQSDRLHLT